MAARWDGKIGKIPKISDKREGKRFSPRLTGGEPDFHECRSTPDIDEERTGGGNGRQPGEADLYTPETVSQYKSQWARYQRALSINPAAIVKSGANQIYKFESCDSLSGFWEVTVSSGPTYLTILKPVLQILCPRPMILDIIDSDAETFTWTQTRGKRSAELNGVILSKEQSVPFGFNPTLDILSLCFSNGCYDDSPEPIVINIQPEGQPELFDSIIIYTTPTSSHFGNSFALNIASNDASPARKATIEIIPAYLQKAYIPSANNNFAFTWNAPISNADFITEYIVQQNTTGQYLDAQTYSLVNNKKFLANFQTHYRVRSVFQTHGKTSISDSDRLYFDLPSADNPYLPVFCDDNYNGISFSIGKNQIVRRPLDRKAISVLDTYPGGLSFATTNKIKTLPLGKKSIQISDNYKNGTSFSLLKTLIQKLNLNGVIIR